MTAQTRLNLTPIQGLGKENRAANLEAFCQHWQIVELACFGSVLRDDFRPDSDIDFLASWQPECRWTLLDFAQMQFDLEAINRASCRFIAALGKVAALSG